MLRSRIRKIYSNRPLRFLRISCRKYYCSKQLKRTTGAAWRLLVAKDFRPRLLLVAAIYSLTSDLKSPENSPISRKILWGWRMATGAFGRELVNLEVAVTDVGTVGEICLSEASCSPTVPVLNPWPELLRFPYFLE